MNAKRRFSTLMFAAQVVVLLNLGCVPRSDAAADESPAAKNTAADSDTVDADAKAAVRPVTADELAHWRATVARIRTELAAVAEQTDASTEESRRRIQALSAELASLERRIAAYESDSAKSVQANKIVVDETGNAGKPSPNHPFLPAVKRARAALTEMKAIKDYSAVLVKQTRIDGKLNEMEFLHAKIRHEPFSVYLRFLAPQERRDREVIFIEGQNDGNLLAHESPHRKGVIGFLSQTPLVGTTSLAPKSPLAMIGNRYPITEIGILNLTEKLVKVGEHDMQYTGTGEDAKYYPDAKVDDRKCEAFVFIHPEQREEFTFHRAEVFIDKELNLPIRYVSYGWPEAPGETPPLIESYTYTRLKLNVGLTDEDFDTKNPKYKFPQ